MSVIRRLPRYYRYLTELMQNNITRISSKDLSQKMGLTASQIRQDLNCFGGFGQQGYGYIVDQLRDEIAQILGLDHTKKAIVLGAGNLGQAVAAYLEFETRGFSMIGIFDNNPNIIGTTVFEDTTVLDVNTLEEFCRREQPEMAVLCTPKEPADRLVEQVYESGIRFFWNFSHYNISRKYPDVTVEAVHLNDSLMTLSYLMSDHSDDHSAE
jgi:redox-sensing transcriptional repressor